MGEPSSTVPREKHAKPEQTSLDIPPIPRENKIWLGIIAAILIVGFVIVFIIQ